MRFAMMGMLIAVVGAMTAERTPAPLPAEQAAREMRLPPGFQASVFAAEPDLIQPVSFCFDSRGRIFVAEALNYGTWQPTGKDRIVILEDTDGDGRADSRKVFYEGFNYITGVEVGFGGVWVISPPGLYFVPDRDGDDKPDGPPELLFDGFGHKESRHNLANGFTWGPDGWLYAGHGRTSPSDVGRPGTPAKDRIHCDGGVYRIHPTRLVFENFADGTTNPWGVDFNDDGECFVSNCVNPHLFHMIPGGHYEPWRNRSSSQFAYERLPTIADHLHYPADRPREMRGESAAVLEMGGGHAHCGTLIYLGGSFPADYRNTVFMCNVHGRRINRDLLKPSGSGYVASHGPDFAISTDPWFMGVTLRTGPDGNVYVSDWSDTGECHTYKPDLRSGRIYCISHGKREKVTVDLYKASDAELVRLQGHRDDWYVRHARRILQERSTRPGWNASAVHDALREQLADRTRPAPARLRALWALHVTNGLDSPRLVALLDDTDKQVRAWAVRLLAERPGVEKVKDLERVAARRDHPVVQLSLASSLQKLPIEQRWSIATGLMSATDISSDANLPLMIWYGVEPLIPADPGRALQLAKTCQVPLVRRYLARRLFDDALVRKSSSGLGRFAEVLRQTTDEVRRDLLSGAREALRGRKQFAMPAGWAEVYRDVLARSTDAKVREEGAALALVFGDRQAAADLRVRVADRQTPKTERIAGLEALIDHRVEGLAPLLHDLLGDADLVRPALRGLSVAAVTETPERVLQAYPKLPADARADAIAAVTTNAASAMKLLDAVEKSIVPRADISAYVARQLYAMNDAKLTGRLKTIWGEVRDSAPQKKAQLAKYKAQLSANALKSADITAGKALFAKTCQACHKLHGEGGTIGPDLTGSNRTDLDYLLSNVIDPSAEVARDYRMSSVRTLDGRLLTGIVVERTPARLVLQTATARVTVSGDDIDSVKDSELSIMPDGQLDSLTRDQVRDLFGYLMKK